MKTFKLFLLSVFCFVCCSIYADDKAIPVEKLPETAKVFVYQNFTSKTIIYAEKDWNTYECMLNDGTKIKFYKNGDWDKIECKAFSVPDKLVPVQILNYVKTNFPNETIRKIDKERYGYEIELSNDLDLKFNKQGVLINIDD